MTLLTDLEEFVAAHRPHGTLTGNATEPACNGYYLLTVACPVWGGVRAVGDGGANAEKGTLRAALLSGWLTCPGSLAKKFLRYV